MCFVCWWEIEKLFFSARTFFWAAGLFNISLYLPLQQVIEGDSSVKATFWPNKHTHTPFTNDDPSISMLCMEADEHYQNIQICQSANGMSVWEVGKKETDAEVKTLWLFLPKRRTSRFCKLLLWQHVTSVWASAVSAPSAAARAEQGGAAIFSETLRLLS